MKKNAIFAACAAIVLSLFSAPLMAEAKHTFEVSYERDAFLLDGKPFQIRCGELHFARIPRAYWRHRIRMCKALGLNTVCAYMFWNYHEMERGEYDFSGEKDIAEFCRIAQEEGMWVLLRPGPYTCAEWEFGGLPWWLISGGRIGLRSRDPRFLEPAKAYLRRVAAELEDLQITRGGPILMAQDENEYGFFGNDKEYIREIYNTMREAGFDVPIFTCNPAYHLDKGLIDETVKVVNFGANPENGFGKLRQVQPRGPLMCGEYYPAWFDSWGQRHHTKPAQRMIDDIDYMLRAGGSFSLYMAHGGTSFGWWAGCNSPFQPQTSSYDYEAPISEQGRATPKFYALRDLLKKYMSREELENLPEVPEPLPLQAFSSDARADIMVPADEKTVNRDAPDETPRTMENLGLGYGTVSYITANVPAEGGRLAVETIRDQAAVFADGKFAGFLDRRYPQNKVDIPAGTKELKITVTHMSRYNFGSAMYNSAKGLFAPVTIDGKEIKGWWYKLLDHDFKLAKLEGPAADAAAAAPCTFKRFLVDFDSQADTFLLVRGWKKGHVWVNGRPLGRFWGIGPTQTMYLPGCWLKKGENEILVWDFGGNVPVQGLVFTDTPVLDEMHLRDDFIVPQERTGSDFTPPANPVLQGEFPDVADAQTVMLPAPCKARKFAFVMDTAWAANGDFAALAEFEILDAAGASVPHDSWKFAAISSEEISAEEAAAENAIDGQISNFWHSRWSRNPARAPHFLVIDMGAEVDVAGFRCTPRQDSRSGRIRNWRFYLAPGSF